MKYYLFLFFFFSTFCATTVGQVPPYQQAKKVLLRERLKTNFYQKSYFRNEEWMRSYKREDIPLFTLFTYASLEDFDMESKLQRFYYRKYSSFTAPKGVRKITYHLGNNWVDSTQASTHVFYYNKKTQRLEKEIQYDRNDFNLQRYDQVKKREYTYQYEENEEEITVKKFESTRKGLLLFSEYVYSKDKSRLLRNKFTTLDYQFDLLRQRIDTTPLNKEVMFTYDELNKLKKVFYLGAIDDVFESNFGKDTLDLSKLEAYTHGWSQKENWLSFLNKSEEEEQSVLFPKTVDLKLTNGYGFSYEDKGNSKILNPAEQSFKMSIKQSSNIYNSLLEELDRYRNTESIQDYVDHKILLFDELNQLSIAYIVNNYHLSFYNRPSFNIVDNTPIDYTFLTKGNQKNQYNLLYIQKIGPLMRPLMQVWFWDQAYFSTFKRWKDLTRIESIIELKPKKGLNEVYLIHNKKKIPLVTIN